MYGLVINDFRYTIDNLWYIFNHDKSYKELDSYKEAKNNPGKIVIYNDLYFCTDKEPLEKLYCNMYKDKVKDTFIKYVKNYLDEKHLEYNLRTGEQSSYFTVPYGNKIINIRISDHKQGKCKYKDKIRDSHVDIIVDYSQEYNKVKIRNDVKQRLDGCFLRMNKRSIYDIFDLI